MTQVDFEALVRRFQRTCCEQKDAEAKKARRSIPEHLYQALSGFANHPGGGVVILGLDEAQGFATTGVEDPQLIQDHLTAMAGNMVPALRLDVTVHELNGSMIVSAIVPEVSANDKPCYYSPQGLYRGSYLRVGNSNRHLSEYEVHQYLDNRKQPCDDGMPVLEAGLEDLDQRAAAGYISSLQALHPNAPWVSGPLSEVLVHTGSAKVMRGQLHPTLAGLLMFGDSPQRFFPQLRLTFLQFFGQSESELPPTGERFLDNRSFEGRLPEIAQGAVTYILTRIRQAGLIQGLLRRDIPEYPEVAIREAVVNALAHRDYGNSARGTQVQVRLFVDRLEIQSPGGLYGAVTVENIDTEQSNRNAVLMRLLEDVRVSENRGTGIQAMISSLREAQLSLPKFDDRRSSFWVTFYNHTLLSPQVIQWLNEFSNLGLDDHQRVALAFLRERGSITNADYRRLCSCDIVEANRGLAGLRHLGLVDQQGTKRWASYQLAHPVATTPPQPESPEDRVIRYATSHGRITNHECRSLLAVSNKKALATLKAMVASGQLRQLGTRKGTHYVPPLNH
jgi:ATP-dependent DNA helicase RecG